MDTFADLSENQVKDRARGVTASCATRDGDVPGISAGHSCDVYAAEELERRHHRTEVMIARALEQS